MKQYKRSTRIGEQLLKDISTLFQMELDDRAPGMITFTHVKVSDDLKYATVYYSCLGDDTIREKVNSYLSQVKKKVRFSVGKHLHMRHIPEFSFKFDPSVEEGIKIEKLLNDIKNDKQ
jgi:ribosome-binding factor A